MGRCAYQFVAGEELYLQCLRSRQDPLCRCLQQALAVVHDIRGDWQPALVVHLDVYPFILPLFRNSEPKFMTQRGLRTGKGVHDY